MDRPLETEAASPANRVDEREPSAQAAEDAAAALAAERDRLAGETAELNDRLLRLRADYENYRRRAERERAEVFDLGSMETVRALLPVLDDFERGLAVASADAEGALRDYAKGMELIYQRLSDSLVKLGLQPIEAEGHPFDPNVHHAVQMEPRDDVADHTILEEYQRGYNFKGKLLRAAMVKVAVKP